MKFSFQYLIAVFVTFLTGTIFFLILKFPSPFVFLILALLWFSLLIFLQMVFREKRKNHTLALTVSTALSTLLLFSVIDDPNFRLFFLIFVALLFGILFGVVENDELPLGMARRPFRRFAMMIWVLSAYAFFSCLFAVGVLFQSEWSSWIDFVLVPGAGIIGGILAGEIWKMYVVGEVKIFLFWRLVVALFIAEIFWSIRLLPFGYLVSGIILTWLWYTLQMLIRFHFQTAGIVWKKQLPFVIVSGTVFLFLALFFIRWI